MWVNICIVLFKNAISTYMAYNPPKSELMSVPLMFRIWKSYLFQKEPVSLPSMNPYLMVLKCGVQISRCLPCLVLFPYWTLDFQRHLAPGS